MRAEAPEPSIRGSYIGPSKAWIIRTYGQDVFDRACRDLPPGEQVALRSEIVSLSWYPLKHWTTFLDAVRREVEAKTGEDEATFDRRHMRETISGTMQTVYRIAFKLMSPTTVVEKVTPLFKRVYSHGTYEVVENKPGRCFLRFSGAPLEMLSELKRAFPLAATWMLETAGQRVNSARLSPMLFSNTFACDLEIIYEANARSPVADVGRQA